MPVQTQCEYLLLLSPCSLMGSAWSVQVVATCSGLSRLTPSAPSISPFSLPCPSSFLLVFLISSFQELSILQLFSSRGLSLISVSETRESNTAFFTCNSRASVKQDLPLSNPKNLAVQTEVKKYTKTNFSATVNRIPSVAS